MNNRILVIYATKYGATEGIATAIAEGLRKQGREVDVRNVKDVFDITGYSAVIIGSPIYYGKVLPELVAFVSLHKNMLHEIPVIGFLSGYSLLDISPEKKQAASAAFDQILEHIELRDIGYFAGKISEEHLSFKDKAVMKIIGAKPGDYRNREAAVIWAQGLIDLCLLQL
ncbi:flavodoxin domain-containing protein [Methanogenium organophilum]|uniref:Flavodoxin domain-containing protein n=1 Tax=Methanogenium organophilum TaxID=2199 RepID=A0A9X9S2H1_METOG|nr:flavodoxin domain-containing protein [Methanogenium organophilum]WAI00649.1 flavodoxin domain-containing protein [Methanogenium organophilum]